MNAEQRVLVALIQIDAPGSQRIVRAALDVVRKITEPPLDVGSGNPRRPFFLSADPGDAIEQQGVFADRYAVADRFPVGEDKIEVARVGIDDDRTRRLGPALVDDVTSVA